MSTLPPGTITPASINLLDSRVIQGGVVIGDAGMPSHFTPNDPLLLSEKHELAALHVEVLKLNSKIQNIHQCQGNGAHWHFEYSPTSI